MTEGQETEGTREAKARVRKLLIARLEEAGMQRPKRTGAAEHEAMQDRLVDRLAYMAPENLVTLAEVLIEAAEGPLRNVWPSEATVRNFARSLQDPPLLQKPIVSSWLASIEGPRADAGGFLVELYRWLRDSRRPGPPMVMDLRLIREEAGQNARRCDLVQDRIARGSATAEDRAWLESYIGDQRIARQIVADGQARRAEQEKVKA